MSKEGAPPITTLEATPSHPTTDPGVDKNNPSADPDNVSGETVDSPRSKSTDPSFKKDIRFWAIVMALNFTSLLTALEATITSTALPSIIANLGGGDLYIWAVEGYFLAMYVSIFKSGCIITEQKIGPRYSPFRDNLPTSLAVDGPSSSRLLSLYSVVASAEAPETLPC